MEAMTVERSGWERRARVHAALADPARLQIVDLLAVGDLAPSRLSERLAMPSNLLAHHLGVLRAEGLITRTRSEGDRRRTYLQLVPGAVPTVPGAIAAQGLDGLTGLFGPFGPEPSAQRSPTSLRRVLFVCTANSARSQLAAALWRRASSVASASGGTHPAERVAPGAVAAAARRTLPLRRARPRRLEEVRATGDLVVTVCDRAYEEIGDTADLHWSVPDPVRVGSDTAFDAALDDLTRRVGQLAPYLSSSATRATGT